MNLRYSKHEREQMVARCITEKDVEEAITRGSKHSQYPEKIVADYKFYSVVYRNVGSNIIRIITVKPRW